jgi:DNA-binding CsgD family transcriptional regulator
MRRRKPPTQLTQRESEVLDLIRQGYSNQGIADLLGITRSGVTYHVSEILSKLGVSSREQAAALTDQRARPRGLASLGLLLKVPFRSRGAMAITGVAVGTVTLGLALLMTGLFSSDSAPDSETALSPGAVAESRSPAEALLALLAQFPASDEVSSYLRFIDYARARQLFGVTLPPQDAGAARILDYYAELSEKASLGPLGAENTGRLVSRAAEWNDQVGFNFVNVDQFLALSSADDPQGVPAIALTGRFDQLKVESTLKLRPDVQQSTYFGVDYFWSLDDSKRPSSRGAPPYAGPWRLVVSNDLVYWNYRTAAMEAMIEASQGQQRSLADLDDFQALAAAFDELGVYSAVVDARSDPGELQKRRELVESQYGLAKAQAEGYLEPYTALAVGVGHDGVEPYALLVFVHSDLEAAMANAAILRTKLESGSSYYTGRPWRDVISDSEVLVEGTVVVARLKTATLSLPFDIYNNLDSLIITR